MLSKSPDDRFNSAAEVAELLEDCLAHVEQPTTTPLPAGVQALAAQEEPPSASTLPNRRKAILQHSGRPPIGKLLAATAFAFSLVFAGVLIVLELNTGTLTIESNGDHDIPIRIIRGDEVVERLTVTEDGATTRLKAGEYVVEIDSGITGYELTGNQVTLKRSEKWIARITKASQALDAGFPSDAVMQEMHDLLAEEARLKVEPRYGQPFYGVIVYAKTRDRIQKDELLLFYARSLYRTRGTIRPLRTTGNGFFLRPSVGIPSDRHIALACIQDAEEENENVKNGFMPDSDRARNPSRAYRANVFDRQSGKPIQTNETIPRAQTNSWVASISQITSRQKMSPAIS